MAPHAGSARFVECPATTRDRTRRNASRSSQTARRYRSRIDELTQAPLACTSRNGRRADQQAVRPIDNQPVGSVGQPDAARYPLPTNTPHDYREAISRGGRGSPPHAEFIAAVASVNRRLFGILVIEKIVRQTEVPQRCDLPFTVIAGRYDAGLRLVDPYVRRSWSFQQLAKCLAYWTAGSAPSDALRSTITSMRATRSRNSPTSLRSSPISLRSSPVSLRNAVC